MIIDYGRRQQRNYTALGINGTLVERVCSFKYPGVHLTKDLFWTLYIDSQMKKARQHLFYIRQLRKFGVSLKIMRMFDTGVVESVLTGYITQ